MNSLDWRYEATKIVRELAGYAKPDAPRLTEERALELAHRAEKLMGEAK